MLQSPDSDPSSNQNDGISRRRVLQLISAAPLMVPRGEFHDVSSLYEGNPSQMDIVFALSDLNSKSGRKYAIPAFFADTDRFVGVDIYSAHPAPIPRPDSFLAAHARQLRLLDTFVKDDTLAFDPNNLPEINVTRGVGDMKVKVVNLILPTPLNDSGLMARRSHILREEQSLLIKIANMDQLAQQDNPSHLIIEINGKACVANGDGNFILVDTLDSSSQEEYLHNSISIGKNSGILLLPGSDISFMTLRR